MRLIFNKIYLIIILLLLFGIPEFCAAASYFYDSQNRLITANYNNYELVINYTYDTIGNRQIRQVINNMDTDGDGLYDTIENDPSSCTLYDDADTDDDGIIDGVEDANQNGEVDIGETDPCNIDTDGDGIQDGTESGYITDDIGLDTDTNIFIPDTDPSTTTDPLDNDTDNDGLLDGEEDTNYNGRVDQGETDPNTSSSNTILPSISEMNIPTGDIFVTV